MKTKLIFSTELKDMEH